MCGIAGLIGTSDVNQSLYDALTILQHRGQDAAGIVTCDNGRLHQRKGNGLVRDVFRSRHMKNLSGKMGIAHCRYPTAGSSSSELAQPFFVNSPYGISLAHNGNLTNASSLREELFNNDLRHLNTDSDSEVLLNVFAQEIRTEGRVAPTADDVFDAISAVHLRCNGAYAVVAMIGDHGIVGFRDPNGIRPLVYGKRESEHGTEYLFASESVALNVLGFDIVGDVAPGEAVYVTARGEVHRKQCSDKTQLRPCIFEHVYFARPDSIMDGISVYKARLRQGERLAAKIMKLRPEHDIDVVIPIPDTSRVAAQVLAYDLGVKFREGLMKNRYIGRTFIMPGQQERRKSVRQKLNAIELEFKGKNVLLVDDSIVRGTTCKQIIQMAREAGANKVYFASAAPAVVYPNVYGIDMPSVHELIAYDRTEEEVCDLIGADWLVYQDLEDLKESSREGNPSVDEFDCSVFTGEYLTGDVDEEYLRRLEAERSDDVKQSERDGQQGGEQHVIGLHNEVS